MKIVIIAIITVFPFVLGDTSKKLSGFDFINLPVSARVAGGAVSLIGENDSILALRSNPAMLAGIKNHAVAIDFSPIIMDIYTGGISSAIPLKNGVVITPSLSYISFGSIDARDENGDELQLQVSPFALSLEMAVSYKFYERLSVGLRLKFIHEQISQRTIHWDETYASGVGADIGIFSDHKIFRYSAGFRNVGFSFDSYESLDMSVKLPTSMFVGGGVIIENDAKLAWFLECERFFYDNIIFRTKLELPLYREILIFRTGTVFSPGDVRHAFNAFGGRTTKSWEYSSDNWLLVAVGATINAKIAKNLLSLDIACQFRKDGVKPGFLFSGTMYF